MTNTLLNNTDDRITSMTKAVVRVFETMPKGTRFHGQELHDMVARIYPRAERMYVDTVLRAMRKKCHYLYKTVSINKSLYERL